MHLKTLLNIYYAVVHSIANYGIIESSGAYNKMIASVHLSNVSYIANYF